MAFSKTWMFVLFALFSVWFGPAQALSFIGCDKRADEVAEGPHSGWAICKARLPIADVRGRGEQLGKTAAISGSHEYVILKVHGSRADILKRAEKLMRSLAIVGYPKLGIVVADGPDPTMMEIYSGGQQQAFGVVRKADAYNADTVIGKAIRKAYRRDIGKEPS